MRISSCASLVDHSHNNTSEAAIACALDYKKTLSANYASDEEQKHAQSACHTRSAQRVLRALLANGGEFCIARVPSVTFNGMITAGIFIKLGQHMSSL